MHVPLRRAALTGTLALATLVAAGAPAADAASPGARLLTTSQQSIVAARTLVVQTTLPKRSTATLRATVAGSAVASTKRLRSTKGGKTRIAVALTAGGTKVVARCTPRSVTLALTVKTKGHRARTYRRVTALQRDGAACAPKPAPTPGPTTTVTTPAPPPVTVTTTTPVATTPVEPPKAGPTVDVANADRCDFLVPGHCLAPFPNDYFTKADPSTATGRIVDLDAASMPQNADGVPMDPTDIDRSDGFSPGSLIQVHVPGLDTPAAYAQTNPVPVNDLARTYDPDQPVVLIDAATGERQLIWSELDANAPTPAQDDLQIHPAVNLKEGHRYIVALRNLKDASGQTIPAGDAFRIYRDGLTSDQPAVGDRRDHMDAILKTLSAAGIERSSLYLAWDFTVASEQSTTSRMLHIRNDAFDQLGDHDLSDLDVQGHAPSYHITSTTNYTSGQDPYWGRRIVGTFDVPCYLQNALDPRPDHQCDPGGAFDLDSHGNPIQHGTTTVPFICNIPHVVIDGPPGTRGRPTMYGHGLFGAVTQVNGGKRGQQSSDPDNPLVMCATEFKGMASDDEQLAAGYILPDMSHFNMMADRLQQGLLNFLYLGRLMIHPDGFAADPAFQADKGNGMESLIDTHRLFYTGVSEGGILGGALTAIAPDFTRAALAVPGMNYSVLLPRSTDFAEFKPYFSGTYPDGTPSGVGGGYANASDRVLVLSLAQMLWDRGEPDGYAQHMTTDPLPDTPAHKVLLSGAFGDHQVSNVTLETEARTIGAHLRTPALDPGRSLDVTPFYGIPAITSWPYDGPASLVVGDIGPARAGGEGTTPAPLTNTAPSDDPDANGLGGEDPHEWGGQGPQAMDQIGQFLSIGGQLVDTCGAGPCYTGTYTGP